MTVRSNYEISGQGTHPNWEVNFARLVNQTPTATQPAALTSRTYGTQLTGTVLKIDDDDDIAIIDVKPGMVYLHKVRNVLTYSGAAEATFAALAEGDAVYYDRSSTMPSDVFLSASPLDKDGNANPLFGHVVYAEQAGSLPVGGNTASTQSVPVMQRGAGG